MTERFCGNCSKFKLHGGDCKRSDNPRTRPEDIQDECCSIGGGCEEWHQADISASVDVSMLCSIRGAIIPKLLGDEMLLRNEYMTLRDNHEVYIYLDGVYRLDTKAGDTRAIANTILDMKASVKNVNEGVSYVMHKTRINRDDINCAPFMINLKNGMYDVLNDELLPHSSDYKSTIQINTTYDSSAECPAITKFLFELMDPVDVPLVIQFIGYCMVQDVAQQKALLIDGSSKNGKSTLIGLITSMVGNTHISRESLEEISKDRFSTMQLSGKLVNAHPDLSSNAILDTSVFKTVVTEPRLTGQGKGKDKITFNNICTHIFACNTLPDVDEDEKAYFRRFLQVTFPHTFDGNKDDKDILNKITTESEKSGFFNVCMIGLRALLEHGEYCDLETTESNKKRYLDKSNPIGRFFDERTAPSVNDTTKDVVYWGYVEWCNEQNIRPVQNNKFWKAANSQGLISTGRESHNGPRTCEGLSLVIPAIQANKNAWNSKKQVLSPPLLYTIPGIHGNIYYINKEVYVRVYGYIHESHQSGGMPGCLEFGPKTPTAPPFPLDARDLKIQAHPGIRTFVQRETMKNIRNSIQENAINGITEYTIAKSALLYKGIAPHEFDEAIIQMKQSGTIFEPQEGYLKCI